MLNNCLPILVGTTLKVASTCISCMLFDKTNCTKFVQEKTIFAFPSASSTQPLNIISLQHEYLCNLPLSKKVARSMNEAGSGGNDFLLANRIMLSAVDQG